MSESDLTPLEGRLLDFKITARRRESGLLTLLINDGGKEEPHTYIISLLGADHAEMLRTLLNRHVRYLETAQLLVRDGKSYEEKRAVIEYHDTDGAARKREFTRERLFR